MKDWNIDVLKYYTAHNKADVVKKILQEYFQDATSSFERKELIKTIVRKNASLLSLIDDKDFFNNVLIRDSKQEDLDRLLDRLKEYQHNNFRRKFLRNVMYGCAASILLFIFIGFYFGWMKESGDTVQTCFLNYQKPILILEDGTSVELSGGELDVSEQNNLISIDTLKLKEKLSQPQPLDVEYRKVIVPPAYTYNVVLSDGTRVKLNAQSSLEYPVNFEDTPEREISLKGEAYLQVAKGEKPFVVKTTGGTVRVYGTTFNIYNGENGVVEVLLVEGRVSLKNSKGDSVYLKPSQMAFSSNTDNGIQVKEVNIEEYLGWISGNFVFKNQFFKRVCRDLSSWYGVNIHVPDELAWERVTLAMERDTELSVMLNFISNIFGLQPQIQGKEVWLQKK